jgi:hypothetical protein
MSAKLAWGAYKGKVQVKIHGFVRWHDSQEDKTKKKIL